jgi:hypothetical protein
MLPYHTIQKTNEQDWKLLVEKGITPVSTVPKSRLRKKRRKKK